MSQDHSTSGDSSQAIPPEGGAPPPPESGGVGPAGKPGKKRKRRLVLKVLVSLAVLIVALVVLAPTILSMGIVRGIVLQQINSRLINGTLDVKDWSFGWTSGIRLEGITLTDSNTTHLISAHEISTPMSLLKAATGHFDLGDVVISDVDFNAVRDRNGVINLLLALKPSNKPPSAGPAKLPDIKGVIHLKNITGTWEDDRQHYLAGLSSLNATITIKDINQPIEDSITLAPQLENGELGPVKIDGTVAAIRNNLLDVGQLAADQTIELDQVDLAPVARVLQARGVKLTITGKAGGKITAHVDTLENISASGGISVAEASAGGAVLKNDTIAYQKIGIDFSASRMGSAGHGEALKLDLPIVAEAGGANAADKIGVHVDVGEDSLMETVEVCRAVMGRIVGGTALSVETVAIGGAKGTIDISGDVGAANLVRQLPHLLHMQERTSVTSGRMTHETTVTIGNNQAVVVTQSHVRDFAGTNRGTAVKLGDSDAMGGVTLVGGPAADLRNINIKVSSAMGNFEGGGATLGKTSFQGSSDLKNVQRELGQFVDLAAIFHAPAGSAVSLSGELNFHAHTDGDLNAREGDIAIGADVEAKNIQMIVPGRRAVNEPEFRATISGNLHHTSAEFVQAIHDLAIGARSPAVDFQAGGDIKLGGRFGVSISSFVVSRGSVDLRVLQEEIGGLLSIFVAAPAEGAEPTLVQRLADNSVRIASGSVEIGGQGRFDQTGFGFAKPLSISVQPIDLMVVDEMGAAETDHLPGMSLVVSGNGTVDEQSIASLKDMTVAAMVGPADKPLLTAKISVDTRVAIAPVNALAGTAKLENGSNVSVSRVELSDCRGDLAGLQSAFGPVIPLMTGAGTMEGADTTQPSIRGLLEHNLIVCSAGTLTASMTGTYEGTTFTITRPLAVKIAGLTLRQQGGGVNSGNFNNQDIAANIGGSVAYADGRLHADLHTLSLTVGNELKIEGNPASPIDVTMGSSREISGSGSVELVNANLPRLIAMGLPLRPDLASLSQVSGGQASGAIKIRRVPGAMSVSADLKVSDLTAGAAIKNETVDVAASATVAADLTTVKDASVDVETSFGKISVSNGQFILAARQRDKLAAVGIFGMVQSVDVEVDKMNLAKLDDMRSLLQTAAGEAEAIPAAEKISVGGGAVQITGGLATIKARISSRGGTTTADVSDVLVQGLAVGRGGGAYSWPRDITARLAAHVDTLAAGEGTGLLDQVADVSVTALSADLGIIKIGLDNQKAITVSGLTDRAKMAVEGGIVVDGEVAPAARLAEVFAGGAANSYPVTGHYHFQEDFAKDAAQPRLRVQGNGGITAFQVLGAATSPGGIAFSEDNIAIGNGFDFDFDTDSLIIDHAHPISLALQSTGAAGVSITGTIDDVTGQRRIAGGDPVVIQMNYDLAKLWTIIKPLLPADQRQTLADVMIAGKEQRTVSISGSFPADKPFNEAIASINAGGYFTVESFSTHGIPIENLDLPFELRGGVLRTVYPDQPEGSNAPRPASCSGGTLDIGIISVDLRGETMLVSMPGVDAAHPHELLRDVSINPAMSKTIFADFLNNPAFQGADNSSGLASLTVLQLRDVPLSGLVLQQSPLNQGAAEVRYSIRQMQLGSPFFALFGNESVSADINDADVKVQGGRVNEDTTIMIDGNKPLRIAGVVLLESRQFSPMTVYFPPALLGNLIPGNVRAYMPDQVVVPLEGDMNHPKLKLDQAIAQTVKAASKKAIVNGLLNGAGGLFGRH